MQRFIAPLACALLCACQPPIDLNVRLWTPVDGSVEENAAGFDLSVVTNQSPSSPTRLDRGEADLAKEIEGVAIGDDGLALDAVLVEAIGGGADRIASGRTGPAIVHADGSTSPEELVAILAPEGIVNLRTESPTPRNEAAVCVGGNGRAYVFGGHATGNADSIIDNSVRIDPILRDAVDIEGPQPPQAQGSCAVHVVNHDDGTSTDTVWLAGGCDAADAPQGLRKSDDQGETFEIVDATPLACQTALSIHSGRMWLLAGDILQVRDAQDGALLASSTLDAPRLGGAILALADGAVLGGGLSTAPTPLQFVTEDSGSLTFTAFGPPGVRHASFTLRDDGEAFALLVTDAAAQLHRLQPAIASAPVQVENGPLTEGGFTPEDVVATPDGGFFVLNDTQSASRAFNRDGSTNDYPVSAFGAQAVREPGGAVLILGGAAAGIKVHVRPLP